MIIEYQSIIDRKKESILNTYHELHQLAEPSWKEEKTSHYIREKLIQAGLKVQTFANHYGLVAEIEGETNTVIGLRADLDALIQEVDGVVKANHSCGHDAHSTMVLYSALSIAESQVKPKNTLRFIFQPAEEKAEGALQMMEDGALQHVKFLGGLHLRPKIEIPLGVASPVILHGSTASLKGAIQGSPAHAARPEEGNNPIEAAALLIQAIKQIRLKGAHSYSIKMTELHAGEASNLIPEKARFTFDLRADSNETMDELIKEAQQTIKNVADTTGTIIENGVAEYAPAAVQNPLAISLAEKAIVSTLGNEGLVPTLVSPGAEDFHFYTLKNPDLKATMIGLGCDLAPGLHHPKMSFNTDALFYGTQILTSMLLEADQINWEL